MSNNFHQIAVLLSFLLISACNQPSTIELPLPTNGKTTINEKGEADSNQKEAWLETIHRAAPNVDWKHLEAQNMLAKYNQKKAQAAEKNNAQNCGIDDFYAANNLFGKWKERGSLNQSGSIGPVAYDPDTDELYVISAGGTLWKSFLDGSNWAPVLDDLLFNWTGLERFNHNGGKRMIAFVDKILFYSDDDGLTWTSSNGLATYDNNWGNRKAAVVLENANYTIYVLTQIWDPGPWESKVHIYKSTDQGENFTLELDLGNISINDVDISTPHNSNTMFAVVRNNNTIQTYRHNNSSGTLQLQNTSTIAGFSEFENLTSTKIGATTYLYINEETEIYQSTNQGNSWTFKGDLPVAPWDCGVRVSNVNPDHLFLGDIEAYRSYNAGQTWTKVNNWGAYYGDTANKLHADMMRFHPFTKSDGTLFIICTNHGGINISYDNMMTTPSLAQTGLNVSQYYSVRTDANGYIYGGTQDQGFQRMQDATGTGILNFDQVISGDYGHIEFSQFGQRLWTVYPGGWVTYYHNPQTNGYTASYDIESDDEAAWIPFIMPSPDASENAVYIAGGNMNGGSGSYIIKLTYQGGNINATQLPFDFLNASGDEIASIAVSPLDDTKWFVATSGGTFYYSTDSGITWTETNGFNGPNQHYLYGSTILASSLNANVVYLGGSGYSNSPVYKSIDGGQTFTAMNNGLPPTLVFELVANSNESIFFAATEAGPYAYIVAANQWYDISGTCAPAHTYWSVEYLLGNDVARFGTYGRGIWDFDMADLVLDIELLQFSATLNEQKAVDLLWKISNEQGVASYQIERSIDGISFNRILEKETAEATTYQAVDENPEKGISYYRLKTNYTDGRSTYSEVVLVNNALEHEVVVYPNPIRNNQNLNFDCDFEGQISLEIYDLLGKRLLEKTISCGEAISLEQLQRGQYVYRLNFGANLESGTLIVQ